MADNRVSLFMSEWIEIFFPLNSASAFDVSLFMSEWIEILSMKQQMAMALRLTLYE